jgi:hypothetical protein
MNCTQAYQVTRDMDIFRSPQGTDCRVDRLLLQGHPVPGQGHWDSFQRLLGLRGCSDASEQRIQ